MSEWWTYGLSDFLMFSPEAYWRLVSRYNSEAWPAQVLGIGALCVVVAGLVQPRTGSARATLVVLAAAWAWLAWAFLLNRYAEIFLAAPWLAWASAAQAVLLLAAATWRLRAPPAASAWRAAGLALAAAALLFPLLAPLTGRSWSEAEVFGWMPDPTALATLGALLALGHLQRWLRVMLSVLPVLTLLLGGATRWLLAS